MRVIVEGPIMCCSTIAISIKTKLEKAAINAALPLENNPGNVFDSVLIGV